MSKYEIVPHENWPDQLTVMPDVTFENDAERRINPKLLNEALPFLGQVMEAERARRNNDAVAWLRHATGRTSR